MTDLMRDRVVAAVGDRYDVQAELGRGGTAVVYRALDVRLRRPVAIKVLPPELAYREDVRARFLREAQTSAHLAHPHIVPIYTVDEVDGLVFFVMGLVEGESLGARLLREPRPPIAFVVRVLAEAADALAFAHQRGVVHRDIKPDNILLDRDTQRAIVTDFGIARALEEGARLTLTGIAVGTPAFMSPEQALGERDVDGRSDIYALGVLGYLMLAGELPFRATNTPAMLMKHISEPPPPLADRHPELPTALVRIVERALCKKPEERWADAALMRDALLGRGAATPAPAAPAVSPAAAPTIAVPPSAPIAAARPAPTAPPMPAVAARDNPGDAFPHPAPLDRGGAHTREMFRQERRLWRERVQERERREALAPWAPAAPPPPPVKVPSPAQREHEQREREALEQFRSRPILERITAFRRRLVGSVALIGFLTVVNMATFPLPWVIFPALGLFSRLRRRWRLLRDQGVTWGDVWLRRVPPHLAEPGHAAGVQTRAQALAARAEARTRALADRRGALWADLSALQRRVRSMRRWALSAALLPVGGLGFGLAVNEVEGFFIMSLMAGTAAATVATVKAGRLRRLGLRTRDLLRGGWEQVVAAADPRPRSAIAAAEAVRLVPADVLAGSYGAAVRRATEDRAQVREALARLSPADRQLISDVQPTVDGLVERVALLAQALHRLDAELPVDQLPELAARLAAARAEPGATPDRERRLQLLERQKVTIEDLMRRRATLSGQLEHASLVLQSVKLDLLKLRAAGVQAALDDVTSATQEARALSRDIGHVLDAAAEVRAL